MSVVVVRVFFAQREESRRHRYTRVFQNRAVSARIIEGREESFATKPLFSERIFYAYFCSHSNTREREKRPFSSSNLLIKKVVRFWTTRGTIKGALWKAFVFSSSLSLSRFCEMRVFSRVVWWSSWSLLFAGRAERETHHHHHHHQIIGILKKWVPKNQRASLVTLSLVSLSPCVALRYSKRKNHHHHHEKSPLVVEENDDDDEEQHHNNVSETRRNNNNTKKGREIFVFETQNPKQKTHFFSIEFTYTYKKWQRPRTSTSPPRNRK